MAPSKTLSELPEQEKQEQHQHQPPKQADEQQQPQEPIEAAPGQNAQRFPKLTLLARKGNTDVRNGKCYILYRRDMDPRWPHPQLIDETCIDRNRLESLNLQRLNPDITERNHVKCLCARVLHLKDDWYAQLWDGTIICSNCARCFHCQKLCFTAARKLNSIDGLVLCNNCMLEYGRYRQPRLKIKVQPLPRIFDDLVPPMNDERKKPPPPPPVRRSEPDSNTDRGGCCGSGKKPAAATGTTQSATAPKNANATPAGSGWTSRMLKSDDGYNRITGSSPIRNQIKATSSTYSVTNSVESSSMIVAGLSNQNGNNGSAEAILIAEKKGPNLEVLAKPRYREEGRRPLRKVYYPNPRPENYGRPDYRLEKPPYLGVGRNAGYQVCPPCNLPAITNALVVPGIARVYHEKSFNCVNCKRQLHQGYQVTGSQFDSCNCPKSSMVWCTAFKCRKARVAHHTEKHCTMEPFHPGGRPMCDLPGFVPRHDPYAESRKTAALNQRRLQSKKAREDKIKRQQAQAAEESPTRRQKQTTPNQKN